MIALPSEFNVIVVNGPPLFPANLGLLAAKIRYARQLRHTSGQAQASFHLRG
jgi:hypothetical protein